MKSLPVTVVYGATSEVVDGELVITNVFPVSPDWDGYRFHGYCRPTAAEIRAAGFDFEFQGLSYS